MDTRRGPYLVLDAAVRVQGPTCVRSVDERDTSKCELVGTVLRSTVPPIDLPNVGGSAVLYCLL
jgi:hypothetical protein